MVKQYYLVKETKYFIDPHGSADEGGIEKKVVSGKSWDKFYAAYLANKDKNEYFQHEEWRNEEDLYSSEDGYNSEASSFDIKPISDDKAEVLIPIIKAWDKI